MACGSENYPCDARRHGFLPAVCGMARPRRRPARSGMSRVPRRQEHEHHASRQNRFAIRGREEICDFRSRQLGVHGLPRRPGRKGFSAREACAGKVRHMPLDRAGATCPLAPRQGGCARRSAGAPLCELSRKPRHRSGEGPPVGGGANESALHLRPVPSRRNCGFAQSRDCRTIFWRTTPRASTARRC